MKIGVLALQGDFDALRKRLEELGAEVVLVKKPEQLDEIDGLIIPGGESSTFLKLLGEAGFEKLKQFVRRSEEHTSELQSPCNLVCRLLLEKKKKNTSEDPRHVLDPTVTCPHAHTLYR